jgi:hypothetical protein
MTSFTILSGSPTVSVPGVLAKQIVTDGKGAFKPLHDHHDDKTGGGTAVWNFIFSNNSFYSIPANIVFRWQTGVSVKVNSKNSYGKMVISFPCK